MMPQKPLEERSDILCQESKHLTISDSEHEKEPDEWDVTSKSHIPSKEGQQKSIPNKLAC